MDALARSGRLTETELVFQKMHTSTCTLKKIGLTCEQLGNFTQAFSHLARINAAINLDYGAGNVEPVLARVRGAAAP